MSQLPEEARALLREIVERLAVRHAHAADLVGHSLTLVPDLAVKRRMAGEIVLHLELLGEARALYVELGWSDLDAVLRDAAEEPRLPRTRLEFGAASFLTRLAEEVSMQACVECAHAPFAALARRWLETTPERPLPARFLAFAAEATNRPRAQEILDLWLRVALEAFALRPGTDARVRELGLRAATTPELERTFRARLEPVLAPSGLVVRAATS